MGYLPGKRRICASSKENMTKYLGVPTSTSSTLVSIVTVSDSVIPARCIWSVSLASGGCLIKNNYNSRYLYSLENSVRTSATVGASESETYQKCVWRMAGIDIYGNDSSYILRELDEHFSVSLLALSIGETGSADINISPEVTLPDVVIWSAESDFTYTYTVSSESEFVTIAGTNSFEAISAGKTKIRVTHKPTGQYAEFYVCACPYSVTVHTYYDHGFLTRNGMTSAEAAGFIKELCDFTGYVYAYAIGLKIEFADPVLITSTADNCTGYATTDALDRDCSCSGRSIGTSNSNDTTHKNNRVMLNDFINSHPSTGNDKYLLWTGHTTREWGSSGRVAMNSGAFTRNGTYTVVLNESEEISSMDTSLYYTFVHEAGHWFGLPDSYCFGDREDTSTPCENTNCAWHLGRYIFDQSCIMADRDDYAIPALENLKSRRTDDYGSLFCEHCTDLLSEWAAAQ